MHNQPHIEIPTTRREFLAKSGGGFGAMALAALMGQSASGAPVDPRAPKTTHFPAKAKNVIFLFMEGGPSHIDLFDPKPLLNELAGQKLPDSFGKVILAMGENDAPLMRCPRKWKQHGESGLWVSDWFPEIATCADDLCVIRSCVSDGINHSSGVCQMNTGHVIGGRPSLGAWATYGLGTENQDMPAFVVLTDGKGQPVNGSRNWGSGFMPAAYQGVQFKSGADPILNLNPPSHITTDRQKAKLDFLSQMDRRHAADREDYSELEARIKSYELAFRMQSAAPDIVDLSTETEETKQLYGIDQKETNVFGNNCLLARRLVENGVRFVQLYSGAGSGWDAHSNIEGNHGKLCKEVDKPIAGLLKDLKRRGLWDETLVVWGGEFGRTPMSEKGNGRDHNPTGFTMWMAGGAIPGGRTIGATDELGLKAIENPLHVHDLHATIMRVLGIDHTKLIYRHKGRPERIDMNEGRAELDVLGLT
ncbi:DUF1501 domain-containing protein [Bremerella sp. T1]|uniref:DUF1501 domain-containing protein n=1 Tax=Bremerella sp. TYQ1 TaxID=3119568 RepID=UPI001CCEFC29|nr:DUF1501 domain-containing protein [Bremerella volcania]UBM33878.1 DUF1501 domain-containing protein [Bremerella volcania]